MYRAQGDAAMEFYAAARGAITPEDMGIFCKIRAVIDSLPDIIFDPKERGWYESRNQYSCHLICHALAHHMPVTVHDGYFFGNCQHSWLVPMNRPVIIDAYPVAGSAPFIVAAGPASPWPRLYKKSSEFKHLFITKKFADRLERTSRAVGETIERLELA